MRLIRYCIYFVSLPVLVQLFAGTAAAEERANVRSGLFSDVSVAAVGEARVPRNFRTQSGRQRLAKLNLPKLELQKADSVRRKAPAATQVNGVAKNLQGFDKEKILNKTQKDPQILSILQTVRNVEREVGKSRARGENVQSKGYMKNLLAISKQVERGVENSVVVKEQRKSNRF